MPRPSDADGACDDRTEAKLDAILLAVAPETGEDYEQKSMKVMTVGNSDNEYRLSETVREWD